MFTESQKKTVWKMVDLLKQEGMVGAAALLSSVMGLIVDPRVSDSDLANPEKVLLSTKPLNRRS